MYQSDVFIIFYKLGPFLRKGCLFSHVYFSIKNRLYIIYAAYYCTTRTWKFLNISCLGTNLWVWWLRFRRSRIYKHKKKLFWQLTIFEHEIAFFRLFSSLFVTIARFSRKQNIMINHLAWYFELELCFHNITTAEYIRD